MNQPADNQKSSNRQLAIELFLLSLLSIYLELFVIRWLSAGMRAFMVFKTFPLVVCFVGLGLGYALGGRRLFKLAPWALLQFVAVVKVADWLGFSAWFFPSFSIFNWDDTGPLGHLTWLYIAVFILVLIILLSGAFALMACIGARLGDLFNSFKPLNSYCINIGGSIFGGIVFSVVAFWGWQPWALLIPAAILLGLYVQSTPRWLKALPICLAILLAVWTPSVGSKVATYWSPYQRIDVSPYITEDEEFDKAGEGNQGIVISINRHFFQYAINLSEGNLSRPDLPADDRVFLGDHAKNYNLPYKLKPAADVLVLGAGSGNDVAAALRNGARHVDAVDIDPAVISLGMKHHPEHPYDSEKVTVICDDARNFLNHTRSTYDLIIFAGLDSHTVLGQGASMRIDNYVYTRESIGKALTLLRDDGLLFLSFCKYRKWLSNRLYCTISDAAGYPPLVLQDRRQPELRWEFFLAGPMVKKGMLAGQAMPPPFAVEKFENEPCDSVLTDDWPFLYVSPVKVDQPYLLVVTVVLLLSVYATRSVLFGRPEPLMWQMFFLGAAFLLLELQSIARLALLYGSTWFTSSVVISGVLVMILVANLLVIKFGDWLAARQNLLYLFLFLTLGSSYFLPTGKILALEGPYLGHMLVTFITLLPMFCAGLIFAVAFRKVSNPGRAMAFNLLGAVFGAMLEYLSNYIGISALVFVAATIYLFSYFCFRLTGKNPGVQA